MVGVISESAEVRPALAEHFDVGELTDQRVGVLVAHASAGPVGDPTWIAYESGDCVLRRSRHERDVVAAVGEQMRAVDHAMGSGLLALRLRSILLPDGGAVLVTPGPIHTIGGFDRRLATRGCTVLPTAVAAVDPSTGALVVPDDDGGRRHQVVSMLLLDGHDEALPDVAPVLALARQALVLPDDVPQRQLDAIASLTARRPEIVRLLGRDEIVAAVAEVGGALPS